MTLAAAVTLAAALGAAWVGFLLGFLCCAWLSAGREEPRK